MWQHICTKFLDQDDEDEIYNRLLHPKMTTDKTPLDYKCSIKQDLRAANTKNIHVSQHQVIKAAGNGLNPNRYQAIMDLYAIENKTFDSLDMIVEILEKYDKNSHVKLLAKLNPRPSLSTTTQNLL